jgi:hypothetical protein
LQQANPPFRRSDHHAGFRRRQHGVLVQGIRFRSGQRHGMRAVGHHAARRLFLATGWFPFIRSASRGSFRRFLKTRFEFHTP